MTTLDPAELVADTKQIFSVAVNLAAHQLHQMLLTTPQDQKGLLAVIDKLGPGVNGLIDRTRDAAPSLIIDISRVPGVMAALASERADPRPPEKIAPTVLLQDITDVPEGEDDPELLALTDGCADPEDLQEFAFVPTMDDLLFDCPAPSAETIALLHYEGHLR